MNTMNNEVNNNSVQTVEAALEAKLNAAVVDTRQVEYVPVQAAQSNAAISSQILAEYRILKGMMTRSGCETLSAATSEGLLANDITKVAKLITKYFATNKNVDVLDKTLYDLMVSRLVPHAEEREILNAVLGHAQASPAGSVVELLEELIDREFGAKAAALVMLYQSGGDVQLDTEMQMLQDQHESRKASLTMELEGPDLYDIELEEMNSLGGLHFDFLAGLEDNLLGARGGSLISFAAAPDAGKTSFTVQTALAFARQMQNNYEEFGDRPIIWLNTEGAAIKIRQRIRVAATGFAHEELEYIGMTNKQELQELYLKQIPSRHDKQGKLRPRIDVLNIPNWSTRDVEQLVRRRNPAVVIVDMVSYLTAPKARFGSAADSDSQSRARIWEQLRNIAVEYDCVIFGTSQLNKEGTKQKFPDQSNMEQSAIGVQGKIDLMLMMGMDELGERGICIEKCKFPRQGGDPRYKGAVMFDAMRCNYYDGKKGTHTKESLNAEKQSYMKAKGAKYNAKGGIISVGMQEQLDNMQAK